MLINEQIRIGQMLVIGPKGEQLGLKTREEALTLASYAGFDLVLISDSNDNAVCKLMDYNKFRYEKKKKLKESQKKQKESNAEMKEYRLSYNIDLHDIDIKVNNAKKYLIKGHKVKVNLRFRGREMQYIELGKQVMNSFIEKLEDVSIVESNPVMDNRSMIAILAPKK